MKNNIVIGVAVVVVLIVVLGFVLGNQGENYSIFPEYATTPAGVQGVDWDYAKPATPVSWAPAAASAGSAPASTMAASWAPAATSIKAATSPMMAATSPMMAAPAAKAINPPATVNSCKALLKVSELPKDAIGAHVYDKGTKEFAKQLLAAPDNRIVPAEQIMVTPVKLKNLMGAAIREAYESAQVTGMASIAALGALVTKQQMKELRKSRNLNDVMKFADRADKLVDILSDVSSKVLSSAKPVCYINQMGDKYALYQAVGGEQAQRAASRIFQKDVMKILSDMNNGGNPTWFAKDMQELSKNLYNKKC